MNDFAVIANEPLDLDGKHYGTGDAVTVQADDCAPLLVLGKVRLSTTIVSPPARRRGRPRKTREVDASTYLRRDLRAEE